MGSSAVSDVTDLAYARTDKYGTRSGPWRLRVPLMFTPDTLMPYCELELPTGSGGPLAQIETRSSAGASHGNVSGIFRLTLSPPRTV